MDGSEGYAHIIYDQAVGDRNEDLAPLYMCQTMPHVSLHRGHSGVGSHVVCHSQEHVH